jgi:hypothetical protein
MLKLEMMAKSLKKLVPPAAERPGGQKSILG